MPRISRSFLIAETIFLFSLLTTYCSSRDFSPPSTEVVSAQLLGNPQHRVKCVEFLVPSANSGDRPLVAEKVKGLVALAKAFAPGGSSEQLESCSSYKSKAIVACRNSYATLNMLSNQRAEPAQARYIMVLYLVRLGDGESLPDAIAREQKDCQKGEFHVF